MLKRVLGLNKFLKIGLIGLVISLVLNLFMMAITGDSLSFISYSVVWVVFIAIGLGQNLKSGGK